MVSLCSLFAVVTCAWPCIWPCDAVRPSLRPGHFTAKAVFVVSRHGSKAWSGGIDFTNETYLSKIAQEKLTKVQSKGSWPWVSTKGLSPWVSTVGPSEETQGIEREFHGVPGQLTSSGKVCERRIGEFYQRVFQHALGEDPISHAYIGDEHGALKGHAYADEDGRDLQSAAHFLSGLGIEQVKGTRAEPKANGLLAEGKDNKLYENCPRASPKEILKSDSLLKDASPEEVKQFGKPFEAQLKVISAMTGAYPKFEDREDKWMGDMEQPLPMWKTLDGSLRPACMLTQVWEAEVASGVPDGESMYSSLGIDSKDIPELMKVCWGLWSVYMNPVNLARFSTEFMVHLLASMQQRATASRSALDSVNHPYDVGLVAYFGHNTNIDFLRQVLGVRWGEGRKDDGLVENSQPYHTRLNIEIGEAGGELFVRVSVFLLTLEQQAEQCGHVPNDGLDDLSDQNLHVLDLVECPGFDSETKLCPWVGFEDMIKQKIQGMDQGDGRLCLEEETAKWWCDEQKEKTIWCDAQKEKTKGPPDSSGGRRAVVSLLFAVYLSLSMLGRLCFIS